MTESSEASPPVAIPADCATESGVLAPPQVAFSALDVGHSALPIVGRVFAALLAIACLTVLIIALMLTPSRTGITTHAQMGLQPCQFEARTGLPCMTCGMTTSFAWFVRGNLLASLWVQPMGTVLATLAAVTIWGGIYVAATGRPAYRLVTRLPIRYTLIPLLTWGVVAWGWKIFIHLRHIDGWGG